VSAAGLKVLDMSGYTELSMPELGPATSTLQKPFPPDAIAERGREVLDQS
jgi:hypothetical protein